MDELLFTSTDRARLKPTGMLFLLVPLGLLSVRLGLAGHWVAGVVLVVAAPVLIVGGRLLLRGAWIKVDSVGISYARWGRGRTTYLAWHEIRAIQVVEAGQRGGTIRSAKAVLRAGRAKTLPLLFESSVLSDPDFDDKVEAIRAFWRRYSSDAAQPDGASEVTEGVPLVVEAPWSRRDAKLRAWSWRYLTVPLLFVLLISAFDGVDPMVPAQLGFETAGTFTVTDENCAASCSWIGKFTPDDGSDTLYNVTLVGGGQNLHALDQVTAVDTGDGTEVRAAGGTNWIFLSVATLATLAVLAAWVWTVPLRALRSLRARRSRGTPTWPRELPQEPLPQEPPHEPGW